MALNSYATLGKSGLRVSPLCLGAMTFGEDWGMGSSPQESEAILSRYRELGGNFLDTSNAYPNGHSEKIIGDALGRASSKRDRMVIGTKFANNRYPGDPNGGGNGTSHALVAAEVGALVGQVYPHQRRANQRQPRRADGHGIAAR